MKRVITAIQITDQLSVSLTEFNRLMTIFAGMAPGVEFHTRLFNVIKTSDGLIRLTSRITEYEVERLINAESLSTSGIKIEYKK